MTEVSVPAPALRFRGLREIVRYRQLVGMLVVRELKVRYKRSLLGLLWTMLNPLLLMIVYTVVFTTVMRTSQPNFSVFLLAGLLPWIFFSTSIMQGLMSVLSNQELIRKIRLPQAVFPLSVVGSNLVNFVLSLVPLAAMMLAVRQPLRPALAILPVSIALLTVFTAGFTLLFATATVFFRDVRHLAEVALQMLLYLSPVLYDTNMLGTNDAWWAHGFRLFLAVNPFSVLIPLVREPVYYGHLPALSTLLLAAAWAAFSFVAGLAIFQRLSPRHILHL